MPRRRPSAAVVLDVAVLCAAVLSAALPALGQDDSLGRFRDWFAATFVEDGARSCYVVSRAAQSAGDYTRRGPAYVQVTRRAGSGEPDVVSIEAGYPHAPGGEVTARIDDERFSLFTEGETAWLPDSAGDRALVAAMTRGARMVVEGTSARGTATTDAYSLLGFSAARKALDEACGPPS